MELYLLESQISASTFTKRDRDLRVDVLRGMSLIMIFVDHIPGNALNQVTVRNFGFSDAAEVFVFLAGYSAMAAYGRVFERNGAQDGLYKIYQRVGRIYVFQIALLLATLVIVALWTSYNNLEPKIVAPILNSPVEGLAHALALHAIPAYLDILPLYVLLLSAFPLIYAGLRKDIAITLAVSCTIWLVTNIDPNLNLPNWMNDGKWYFNPFAWQFLYTIGAVVFLMTTHYGGSLPRIRWLAISCVVYLIFALLQSLPWSDWGLPDLRLFHGLAPTKANLSIWRLLDILALSYLILSSTGLGTLARRPAFAPLAACGRHSLEVFAAGCLLALLARLIFRTMGNGSGLQWLVNAVGITGMLALALLLEHRRLRSNQQKRDGASSPADMQAG